MLAAAAATGTLLPQPVPTVGKIDDVSGFLGLQEEWGELLCASEANCLFLTWEWLYTWWKHLAEDRKLFILTVRSGGQLIAVAPLCSRGASIRGLRPFPTLEFLGSGFVGSDYLDIIVRRGWEEQVYQILEPQLSQRGLALRLTNVAGGNSYAAGLAKRLSQQGWTAGRTTINICPYIPLEGKSWAAYLACLSSQHRYNFNRKSRRLHQDYSVSFEPARTEAECRESIDLTIAQHKARWQGRGESDAFHTPELVVFHQDFTRVALERGWLRLYVLRLNDRPAACLYGFLYARKFYFYQSGMDPAFEKSSVGLISMGLAIRAAMEEGTAEYDLLHGAEAYKFQWASDSRELARWELYPAGVRGWISKSSMKLGRASRTLARNVLTPIL